MPKTEIDFPARLLVSFSILILLFTGLTGCGSVLQSAGGTSGTPGSTGSPAAPGDPGTPGAPAPPGNPGTPAPSQGIAVAPATSVLRVDARVKFSAVSPTTNKGVSWSVNGIVGGNATIGTIDSTGMYQAPQTVPSPNSVSIGATSVVDATLKGASTVTVQNPIPGLRTILPTSIAPGNFTLSVSGKNFASGAVVVWGTKFLSTTFISPTELRATGNEPVSGTVKVIVQNPDPGGTGSGAINVLVASAAQPSGTSPAIAARFLEQATWGPTPNLIALVQQTGIEKYLFAEFTYPASTFPAPKAGDGMEVVQANFFLDASTKTNQLRQRVAFALSQIMVASANKVNNPSAFVLWQNMFQRDAFGNFLTLLTDVTVSPTMGNYLDMVNNDKPDPAAGTAPNENYAREVLQLFTIGLDQLNPDGTLQVDGSGNPIPTYTQETVEGFAHAFTGWTYPTKPGEVAHFGNPPFYSGPMIPFEDHHDTGPKQLLTGVVLPAGGTARADLAAALQNIFNHPNVGPFVSKQLIQHLVSSNPSPEYVGRVAAVFNNNGKGVRGDLAAVVKALLLDQEARRGDDPTKAEPTDGRLKEPVQFIMNITRALNGTGDGACLASYASAMKQPPFFSPSVFNFFHPNHVIEGTSLLGPEFEILDSGTIVNRINFVNTYVYGTPCGNNRANIAPYAALAGNPTQLVNTIASIMLHGDISADVRNTVVTAITPITDLSKRTQAALYLIGTSSQFQVQH